MTTKQEIGKWFDRGVQRDAEYMLVLCDTFDHEDYPVYADSADACRFKYLNPGDMQRVMEVYDLHADKDVQLGERRAWRLP